MVNFKLKKEYGRFKTSLDECEVSYEGCLPTNLTKDGKYNYADLPPLAHDTVFKKMFTDPGNEEFACRFINSLFEVDLEYLKENLKVIRNELYFPEFKSKQRTADFLAQIGDTYFVFEMNNTPKVKRNALFAHRLFAQHDEGKKETLYNNVVLVSFNNYTVNGKENTFYIYEDTDGNDERTNIVYVDVYLPNIVRKFEKLDVRLLNEAERNYLGAFIAKEKEARLLTKGDRVMTEMVDRLSLLKDERNAVFAYVQEDDMVVAYKERGREVGRKEGREEGFVEGQEKGLAMGIDIGQEKTQIEMIVKMIKEGVPLEIVERCTGLSSERIQSIVAAN